MARTSWPPRFLFQSGRLCLDFAHTGDEGRWKKFERLLAPSDLGDWLAASPLALSPAAVQPAELAAALALRRAIWEGARSLLAEESLAPATAATLVSAASAPDLVPTLVRGALSWSNGASATAALSNVARDALRLFGTEDRARLRECANPRCPLFFFDASRPGQRQWCSMRRCGNLAKTRRYRSAKRQSPESDAQQGRR